jgi:hypothetical protein
VVAALALVAFFATARDDDGDRSPLAIAGIEAESSAPPIRRPPPRRIRPIKAQPAAALDLGPDRPDDTFALIVRHDDGRPAPFSVAFYREDELIDDDVSNDDGVLHVQRRYDGVSCCIVPSAGPLVLTTLVGGFGHQLVVLPRGKTIEGAISCQGGPPPRAVIVRFTPDPGSDIEPCASSIPAAARARVGIPDGPRELWTVIEKDGTFRFSGLAAEAKGELRFDLYGWRRADATNGVLVVNPDAWRLEQQEGSFHERVERPGSGFRIDLESYGITGRLVRKEPWVAIDVASITGTLTDADGEHSVSWSYSPYTGSFAVAYRPPLVSAALEIVSSGGDARASWRHGPSTAGHIDAGDILVSP